MKLKIKEFFWRIFGYPDAPPRTYSYKLSKINKYTNKEYTPRYASITRYYVMGLDLEEIATIHNVTRERVRQCLWKCYRESRK